MTTEKELKPKSFRIDDETAEKFKQISSLIGGNQQEALSKLIEAYEFQQGKAILTEKKEDIETFEKYVTILTRMFMGSLEANQNITETVRAEFDALLKSKDSTIQDLQEKLTVAKQLKEEATLKAKTLTDDNSSLTNRINSILKELEDTKDNYEGILEDKNSLNKALTNSYNEVKAKVEGMAAEYSEFKEKAKQLDKVTMERDTLQKEKSRLEDALRSEAQHAAEALEQNKKHYEDMVEGIKQKAELSQQKALLELERKYQDQLQQLKEEKQREVDKYQQKYFDLLERMNSEKEKEAPAADTSDNTNSNVKA
jgi:predicted transcriptional regulator